MKNETNGTNSGIGFLGALAILFIGLKLGNIINWTWLWVLSPLWIPASIALVIILGIMLVAYGSK